MVLPLDFLFFTAITVLTTTFLLVNYVSYLSRGRNNRIVYEALALVIAVVTAGVLLGSVMIELGEQYGSDLVLSRLGFTFGWAFMLTLGSACVSIYERHSKGMISITLNIIATPPIGFGLVAGLLFSAESLPPLPTSILNLGLAALFTSFLKLVFEKRPQKGKKGFRQRLSDLFKH